MSEPNGNEVMTVMLPGSSASQPAVRLEQVGPYQLVRVIGEGGMGTVYLGQRADHDFRKHVAIKVVKLGMDSNEILARFRRERQILASLDHPNIAKLLDGGTSETGQPYFVMEYVQGRSITEYCDSHKLTTRERLRLFRDVCAAVQYAHQNLVVHRDLKPANILVTAEGKTKLLDFGLAKLLNADVFAGESPPTATHIRLMTPEYASPEQARGEPLTTASDVYALGVILYELLAGQRPYQFTNREAREVDRVICEEEPLAPSTAVVRASDDEPTPATERFSLLRGSTPERLQRELRGDIDNIIMMALRKEPQRRYASADALSEDIRRHLENHPVVARSPTWRYRAIKYVRRHRAGVSAAALVFVALVGFGVMQTIQSQRIAKERDTAERARHTAERAEQKATRVTAFLVGLFESNDPAHSKGQTLTARVLLDRGADRLKKELQDQPELQGELLGTVGNLYEKLGLFEPAAALLEQAAAVNQRTHGAENVIVADGMRDLGRVRWQLGKYAEAEALHRGALAMHRKLLGPSNLAVAADLRELSRVLSLNGTGKLADSEGAAREAVAMHRVLLGQDHVEVATDLIALGDVLITESKSAEAEQIMLEALAVEHRALGTEDPMIAETLVTLGSALWKLGRLAEAEARLREGYAMTRKLLGDEHPGTGIALNNLANVLVASGALDEAETAFRDGVALSRKTFGNDHQETAISLNNLSNLLTRRGKHEEAEQLAREALAIGRKQLGNDHDQVATLATNLSRVLRNEGKLDEGETLAREAVATLRANKSNDVAIALADVAAILSDRGKLDEAERMIREALEVRRTSVGVGHFQYGVVQIDLAEVLLRKGDVDGAHALVTEALAKPLAKQPATSRHRARAKLALAGVLLAQRKPAEAEPLLLEALAVLVVQMNKTVDHGLAVRRLVAVYEVLGPKEKAAEYRAQLRGLPVPLAALTVPPK